LVREENPRLVKYDAQRSRFAAPHTQRTKLTASVNNALLGLIA